MRINKNGQDKVVQPGQLDELALSLARLRDTCVQLSMLLRDQVTENDSPERDQVISEVERYLSRFRAAEWRPQSLGA